MLKKADCLQAGDLLLLKIGHYAYSDHIDQIRVLGDGTIHADLNGYTGVALFSFDDKVDVIPVTANPLSPRRDSCNGFSKPNL